MEPTLCLQVVFSTLWVLKQCIVINLVVARRSENRNMIYSLSSYDNLRYKWYFQSRVLKPNIVIWFWHSKVENVTCKFDLQSWHGSFWVFRGSGQKLKITVFSYSLYSQEKIKNNKKIYIVFVNRCILLDYMLN